MCEEAFVDDLEEGKTFNGKEIRVHLDGHDLTGYLSGATDESPRNSILYFDQGAILNEVRVGDFKAHFATLKGNITKAVRDVLPWP